MKDDSIFLPDPPPSSAKSFARGRKMSFTTAIDLLNNCNDEWLEEEERREREEIAREEIAREKIAREKIARQERQRHLEEEERKRAELEEEKRKQELKSAEKTSWDGPQVAALLAMTVLVVFVALFMGPQ